MRKYLKVQSKELTLTERELTLEYDWRSPTTLLILVASLSLSDIFFLMMSSRTTKDIAFSADDIVL